MSSIGVRNVRALKLRKALKPGGSIKHAISSAEEDSSSILQSISKLEKFTKKKKAKAKTTSKQLQWHEEQQQLTDKLRNLERDIDLVITPYLQEALPADTAIEVPQSADSAATALEKNKETQTSGVRFAEDAPETKTQQRDTPQDADGAVALAQYWDAVTRARESDERLLVNQFRGVQLLLKSLQRTAERQRSSNDSDSNASNEALYALSSNLGHVLQQFRQGMRTSLRELEKEGTALEHEVNESYKGLLSSLRGSAPGADDWSDTASVTSASSLSTMGGVEDNTLMQIVEEIGGDKVNNMQLRLEAFEQLCGLRDLYVTDYEEEQENWRQQCAMLGVPASDALGGWSKPDQDRFLKVVDEEKRKGKANAKARIMARMKTEMPQCSELQRMIHVDWWEQRLTHQRRVRDRRQTWIRERSDAIKAWRSTFAEELKKEEAALAKEMESKATLALKSKTQKRLEKLRNEKIKQLTEEAAKKRELAAIEEAAEKELEEANARYRGMMKQRMSEETAAASGLKQVERIVQEEKQKEEEAARKEQAEHDWQRIGHRDELYRAKLEEQRLAEELAAQEEADKAARLASIVESAPYAERLQAIIADPNRTRQHTQASRIAEDYTFAAMAMQGAAMSGLYEMDEETAKRVKELRAKEYGLYRNTGYSDEKLFSDVRFQLSLALRDAGLHKSEYARQVMHSLAPSVPNAMQTSAQFPFSK